MDLYVITADPTRGADLDMAVTRVPPVMGMEWSLGEYFGWMSRSYRRWGEVFAPTQLGCALAHVAAYRQIVARGRGGLIFEDDIELDPARVARAVEVVRRAGGGAGAGAGAGERASEGAGEGASEGAGQRASERASQRDPAVEFIHFSGQIVDGEYFPWWGWWDAQRRLYRVDTGRPFWIAASYFVTVRAAQALLEFHGDAPHVGDPWEPFFAARRDIVPWHYPIFVHPERNSQQGAQQDALTRTPPHRGPLTRARDWILGKARRLPERLRLEWESRGKYGPIPEVEER